MKILLATEKPFGCGRGGIKDIVTGAGHELALLEKYTDKSQLLAAVSDAEAIIIRSDKITAEVIAAAPQAQDSGACGCRLRQCRPCGRNRSRYSGDEYPGQNSMPWPSWLSLWPYIWPVISSTPVPVPEIAGKRMGCHAFGNIGKLVARYAHGFGMTVYASGRRPITDPECDHPLATAEELYKG